MFFPRNVVKVLMQPGAVMGETNGLYAACTVNTSVSPRQMTTGGINPHRTPQATLKTSRSTATLRWR
jgi:hypothetical protein